MTSLTRSLDGRAWILEDEDGIAILEQILRCPECGYVSCRCEDD
jgi:hypothetical protein